LPSEPIHRAVDGIARLLGDLGEHRRLPVAHRARDHAEPRVAVGGRRDPIVAIGDRDVGGAERQTGRAIQGVDHEPEDAGCPVACSRGKAILDEHVIVLVALHDRGLTECDLAIRIQQLQAAERFKRQAVLEEADGDHAADAHVCPSPSSRVQLGAGTRVGLSCRAC